MVDYSDKKRTLKKLLGETVELLQFVVQVVLEDLDHDWNWYSPAVLVLWAVDVQQMLEYLSLEEQVVMEASEEPVMLMASSHLKMVQSEL